VTVRLEWARFGRPAALALREAVSRVKGDDALAPVSVVVPSNQVGVATRRLLASGEVGPLCGRGTGVAAVCFLTVYRMAELLGSARLAGEGRRPVSTPVLAAGLRRALAAGPGVFAEVADHPATEMALVAAYKQLRDVSAQALDHLAAQSDRAADVVRLCRAARALLAPQWYDEEDLIEAAIARLGDDQAARRALGPVIVYLPERLSRHGSFLVNAVGMYLDVLVLAGTTGDTRADAEVARSLGRLDVKGGATVPLAGLDPLGVVALGRTRLATTSDADEEVRAAVRAVTSAVRTGTALERVAILYPAPEPYARLVDEQLSAAGIAHNGAAVVPLTARVAGRTLLGLLRLPEGGMRREDLFAWLAGAPLRHQGQPVPVTAWERVSREAGVVTGRDHWDRLLNTYAQDREAQADLAERDPDQPRWKADKGRQDAGRARDLRRFVLALIDDLDAAATTARPWAERAAWARGRLSSLLGGERWYARWPPAEQKAAERVERSLDRLSRLDPVDGPSRLDVFARALQLELEADLARQGRLGEGVVFGPVGTSVGLDLDLVVVLGLAEGSLPAPVAEDSLLPDDERQATGGELVLSADSVERQHRELLASLAGAGRQLLTVPRGDLRRSSGRVASRWALDIAGALAGERIWSNDLFDAHGDWLDHVASYDAGLRTVEFPSTEQEYRLRALLAHGSGRLARPALGALGDRALSAGAEVVAERGSARFSRFDGNLAGQSIPSPAQYATTATRLESWATCPFAYFAHEILGVEPVENPEDRLTISPLDLGSLVHEILEKFIVEVLARPPDRQPAAGQAWSGTDPDLLVGLAGEICDRYEARGIVGRPLFWQRDKRRLMAGLGRLLEDDSEHRRQSGTRPVAAELAFGRVGDVLNAVAMDLPDGRSVHFRGKADRLDVAADGTLEVIDYKTGRADRFRGLSEDNPDAKGTKLQLVVYALAARLYRGAPGAPVRAGYWFVSSRENFKRVGYAVTPEVLSRVSRTVGQIVAGIEQGVFPNHPTATSTSPFVECPYCDPDAMGVTELRRRLQRKRAGPALAPFFDLAEPVAPVATDDGEDLGA
jgi:hypothetical protein